MAKLEFITDENTNYKDLGHLLIPRSEHDVEHFDRFDRRDVPVVYRIGREYRKQFEGTDSRRYLEDSSPEARVFLTYVHNTIPLVTFGKSRTFTGISNENYQNAFMDGFKEIIKMTEHSMIHENKDYWAKQIRETIHKLSDSPIHYALDEIMSHVKMATSRFESYEKEHLMIEKDKKMDPLDLSHHHFKKGVRAFLELYHS
jgi:hypothetical protein